MYQIEEGYWKEITESILEADSKRVAGYFDLHLKNDKDGIAMLKHLFTLENERLIFYKIPQDELKKFWELVKKQAFSYKTYAKEETKALNQMFWDIYTSL